MDDTFLGECAENTVVDLILKTATVIPGGSFHDSGVIEQQTPAAFFQPPPVVGKIAVIKIVQVQAAAAFVERIENGDFSVIDIRHGDHEFPQLFDGAPADNWLRRFGSAQW